MLGLEADAESHLASIRREIGHFPKRPIRESGIGLVRLGGRGPYAVYRRGELEVLTWDALVKLCGDEAAANELLSQWR